MGEKCTKFLGLSDTSRERRSTAKASISPYSATMYFFTLIVILYSSRTFADDRKSQRPNIVFICADDMNFDSAGCYGCKIPDITPHIDRIAIAGTRFHYAYATVAVCQPVREIMHCGKYPHRCGAMGFYPLNSDVRTLNQQLRDAGYLISMVGKNGHYKPESSFPVDFQDRTINRSAAKLAEATTKFIESAKTQGKPFFHHVNCGDPHHPLIGAKGPSDLADGDPPSRWIQPEEIVEVPGFLEDLPEVRQEMAQYYTNVKRLDDCVGAILNALDGTGQRDNTIVMFFGGDHGMAWPFAKSNVYENSSRGSLIFRWPGVVAAGRVDRDHLVSTLDFTPTLLDACRIAMIPDMDGRSFFPVLKGESLPGWDRVYTFYNQGGPQSWSPMRCVRTKDRSYIWNGWCDGATEYQGGLWSATGPIMKGTSLTWPAYFKAAPSNPAIQARIDSLNYRTPEEFYDMSDDPFERRNLIANADRRTEIEDMRADLLALMRRTGDPLTEAFAERNNRDAYLAAMDKLKDEYRRGASNRATPTKSTKPSVTGSSSKSNASNRDP